MGMPRTTIVGGRPPKSKEKSSGLSKGIEQVVQNVAQNLENLPGFLENPVEYARSAGINLDPMEASILKIADKTQLVKFVEMIQPKIASRRNFIKQAASVLSMLGASWSTVLVAAKGKNLADGGKGVFGSSSANPITGAPTVMPAGITPGKASLPWWLPAANQRPIATPTSSYGITPTDTPTITPTSTPMGITPTSTPSPTSTPMGITPTPPPSPTSTATGAITITPGIIPTPTPSPSNTPTQTSTNTPSPGITPTPPPSPSKTPTQTVTDTPSPGITPSPPPTPSRSPTSTPIHSPTPEPPSPTGFPETPTPTVPAETGVYIVMPSHFYRPGDFCNLKLNILNNGDALTGIPLFVVLQVGSNFYCGPDWKQPPDLSYYRIDLPEGWTEFTVISDFEWPEGAGSVDSLFFWAGMTDLNLTNAFGHIDSWKFGFGD